MVCLLLAVLLSAPVQTDSRIVVFVSAPLRDGFVDTNKDIQDSIKDVRSELERKKDVIIVDDPSHADVLLTIVTRGIGTQHWGERTNVYHGYYSGTDITTTPIMANTFWVSAVLKAGTYQREIVGTQTQESAYSLGAWTTCAERIAKDLRAWVTANATQLRAKRTVKQ
ncbi:MAG: hypothetical protein DMF86_14740 [Acidobacteria bacterium]|nr:MAG: hypothetical protein DMF86_14740 [Acidobacteriota bacterium]